MSTAQHARTNGHHDGPPDLPNLTIRLWDVATPLVRQVLRTPGLGPVRQLQAALADLAEAAWDVGRAGSRYSMIVSRIWAQVATDLLADVPGVVRDPGMLLDSRRLLQRFYDVAEDRFSEAFHTSEYIDAQAELGATTMAYRVAEQPIAQMLLSLAQAASLADVDAAHRNVHELRRTVRELRRRVRALERAAAADASAGAGAGDPAAGDASAWDASAGAAAAAPAAADDREADTGEADTDEDPS